MQKIKSSTVVSIIRFFSADEKKAIEDAVRKAEHQTSGEIRVHLENFCKQDVLNRATFVFSKLKMHKTAQRNGVLFYLAVNDRKFAIIGDVGINAIVPSNFWDDIKQTMHNYFKEKQFADGIIKGIEMVGEHLSKNFPYIKDSDINEFPDEISYGKN